VTFVVLGDFRLECARSDARARLGIVGERIFFGLGEEGVLVGPPIPLVGCT